MKPVRPTSKQSTKYGNANTKKSHLTCTVATKPRELFKRSKLILSPSSRALIHCSLETDGIYSYHKQRSQSTSSVNHYSNQTSPPERTSTGHSTLMLHPWTLQDVGLLPMQKDLHEDLGTTASTKVTTSDRHRTTTDASWSSTHQHWQSLFWTLSSSNTQPCQSLH